MRTRKVGWLIPLGFAVAVAASGCATVKPMPLGQAALDTGKESIALMTVRTANEFRTGWQPNVLAVFVRDEQGEKTVYSFSVHDPDRHADESFNEYLISVGLPPGKYKLVEIRCLNRKFPIAALASIPIYSSFELTPHSVVYLGRVEAVVRERKNDTELRAGPLIPLIDQSVAGYSGGTFHVHILNNYDADLAFFREKYPALEAVTVDQAVLPEWRQPTKEDMQ